MEMENNDQQEKLLNYINTSEISDEFGKEKMWKRIIRLLKEYTGTPLTLDFINKTLKDAPLIGVNWWEQFYLLRKVDKVIVASGKTIKTWYNICIKPDCSNLVITNLDWSVKTSIPLTSNKEK